MSALHEPLPWLPEPTSNEASAIRDPRSAILTHFNRLCEAPDAIPRLRRFILDLAIRGKLVPQDPSDEPASELVKRATKPLSRAIEDPEPPFALPFGWAWSYLGDVIQLLSGQHLQPDEYSGHAIDGPPYITGPADFGSAGLIITRYAKVRKAVAKQGQILLTVKGAGVGKTALCDLPEVAISRQLMAMTPKGWSDEFLMIVTHRLAEALKESARSLIPGISRSDVDDFLFALPPLAEQYRIVAKVDELMALCGRLEAAQAERDHLRKRLLESTLYKALA